MSHHPPISRFLLISGNNWRFHGYYEFIAKLKGFTGNVIGGCLRGPNIVDFGNGDTITYNLPNQNITGLMYGKRVIEWDGRMDFYDSKNNIQASLSFTEPPSFFQKFTDPTDVFRGHLKQEDKIICEIYGSPVSHLMFGKEM